MTRKCGAERTQRGDEIRSRPLVRRQQDFVDRQRFGVDDEADMLLEELRDERRAAARDVEDDAGGRGARRDPLPRSSRAICTTDSRAGMRAIVSCMKGSCSSDGRISRSEK